MKSNCKVFAIVLLVLVLSTSLVVANTVKFKDVSTSHWAYSSIKEMSEKGIVKGYSDGTFKPNNTVTYAEFIKMVCIVKNSSDIGNSSNGKWYENYYNQALKNNYFTENEISLKNMENGIPRKDMALIVSNTITKENTDTKTLSFSDVLASDKMYKNIEKAVSNGILEGYSDETFKPGNTLTRAESITVINRLLNGSDIKVETPTEKYTDCFGNTYNQTTKALPYRNITKIEKNSKSGDIWVYSNVEQNISLIINNDMAVSCSPADSEYYKVENSYVYLFTPQKTVKASDSVKIIFYSNFAEAVNFKGATL